MSSLRKIGGGCNPKPMELLPANFRQGTKSRRVERTRRRQRLKSNQRVMDFPAEMAAGHLAGPAGKAARLTRSVDRAQAGVCL